MIKILSLSETNPLFISFIKLLGQPDANEIGRCLHGYGDNLQDDRIGSDSTILILFVHACDVNIYTKSEKLRLKYHTRYHADFDIDTFLQMQLETGLERQKVKRKCSVT